jgi:hypothetical protein
MSAPEERRDDGEVAPTFGVAGAALGAAGLPGTGFGPWAAGLACAGAAGLPCCAAGGGGVTAFWSGRDSLRIVFPVVGQTTSRPSWGKPQWRHRMNR